MLFRSPQAAFFELKRLFLRVDLRQPLFIIRCRGVQLRLEVLELLQRRVGDGLGQRRVGAALGRADANLVTLPDAIPPRDAAILGCRFATAYRAVITQGLS